MPHKKQEKENTSEHITHSLQKLQEIVTWFEHQKEVNLEEGLQKVKEGADLIKHSKARLKELDNAFKEVEKDLDESK